MCYGLKSTEGPFDFRCLNHSEYLPIRDKASKRPGFAGIQHGIQKRILFVTCMAQTLVPCGVSAIERIATNQKVVGSNPAGLIHPANPYKIRARGISFCPDSAEIDLNLQRKPASKGSKCLKMSHSAKVRESVEPLEIQKVIQKRGVLTGSMLLKSKGRGTKPEKKNGPAI